MNWLSDFQNIIPGLAAITAAAGVFLYLIGGF
jgi:hypothetical protein